METPRSADTIDLSKSFLRFIQLLSNNLLLVAITLILCVGLGYLYYWLSPKTYESKMIIQSDILSESYSLKLAENLNSHIRDGDIYFVASKLSLTNEDAGQLREFKIVSALTPMSQQMAEKDKIIMVISVRVQDNTILPNLQKGIIQYYTSNDYIKKRVDENRKKYQGLIAALDREIKMMDTLKSRIANGTFASKVGGVSIVDFSGLYGVAANLYEKKYDAMVDLATVDSVQIIEELAPYGKPVWPKLSIVLLTSLALAFIILFVLISYKSLNNQVSPKIS